MKNIDIRIKRTRTSLKNSVFELVERWASLEGRSLANAMEIILEGGPSTERFNDFARKERGKK